MRALSHLIARDHDTVVSELRTVVEENIDDVEPYFALGAMFRSRGEHERAIRVHQALALRERDKRKLRQRAMYELGLDFRAAGHAAARDARDGGGPARGARPRGRAARARGALRGAGAVQRGRRAVAAARPPAQRGHDAAASTTCSSRRRRPRSAATISTPRSSCSRPRRSTSESAHFFAAAAELAAARGNHRGAKERLKQALIADPALAPHVLPGLIAAEQGLTEAATPQSRADDLADAEAALEGTPQLAGGDRARRSSRRRSKASRWSPSTQADRLGAPIACSRAPGRGRAADRAAARARADPRAARAGDRCELTGRARAELATKFPDALAARVATARLALAGGDAAAQKAALEVLVAEHGALAWALRGRWQCGHCGNRPGPFSWRCGQCRRWGTLRMETGVEPPPVAVARAARGTALAAAGRAARRRP